MGKKDKKRSRHHEGSRHIANKKHKQHHKKKESYWVSCCRESKPREGQECLMTVVISQSDLTDGHTHVAQEEQSGESKQEEGAIDEAPLNNEQTATSNVSTGSTSDAIAANTTAEKTHAVNPIQGELEATKSHKDSQQHSDYSRAFIAVKRLPSAEKRQQSFPGNNREDFRHFPNGDCGDGIVNPHPKHEVADKYWAQRRRLFSRYDSGIELDKEGWYSVTPEAIANHIAKRVVTSSSLQSLPHETTGIVVLDAFCGCGGNAIALAKQPKVSLVVCVDTNLTRLKMAAKNASIYNIAKEKLLFVHDDAIRVLSMYSNGRLNDLAAATSTGATAAEQKVDGEEQAEENAKSRRRLCGYPCHEQLPERLDCVFLSPPWGGSEYEKAGKGHFSVETHISIIDSQDKSHTGQDLLAMAARAVKKCVYFLPRNLNGIAMGKSALQAGYAGEIEVEKNVLNGKLKTITCYLGFDAHNTI